MHLLYYLPTYISLHISGINFILHTKQHKPEASYYYIFSTFSTNKNTEPKGSPINVQCIQLVNICSAHILVDAQRICVFLFPSTIYIHIFSSNKPSIQEMSTESTVYFQSQHAHVLNPSELFIHNYLNELVCLSNMHSEYKTDTVVSWLSRRVKS